MRSYQGALATFLDFGCDPRYGWLVECERRVGAVPVQVCFGENTVVHAADYEGRPQRRPLSRAELQAFFDAADDRVETVQSRGRKGWLAAFRDATLFKVVYGWGLRRREAAMLDVEDFTVNPAAPQLGRLGVCHVRYGKAMRGSPPRRRAVATVMPWAAEALAQYLAEVRPLYDCEREAALWLTERDGRISVRRVDEREVRRGVWNIARGGKGGRTRRSVALKGASRSVRPGGPRPRRRPGSWCSGRGRTIQGDGSVAVQQSSFVS